MNKLIRCSICGKPAVVCFTFVGNGKAVDLAFCEKHAVEAGVAGSEHEHSDDRRSARKAESPSCSSCGYPLVRFEETGHLGCPRCYDELILGVEAVIAELQPGARHLGKIPCSEINDTVLSERVDLLKSRMAEAINAEDYEAAAVWRDLINVIENQRPIFRE